MDFSVFTRFAADSRVGEVVRRVQRDLKPLQDQARRIGGQWQKASLAGARLAGQMRGLGLAGLAAAGGGLALFGRMTARADTMVKFADRVGIGTERLQELQFIAERTGVGDRLNDSLRIFSVNLGKMKTGSGELYSLLSKAGPAFLKELEAASSTDEALDLVLAKLGEIEDPARRSAFAVAAFGESGLAMINMAQQGEDELGRLARRAHELGFVMSEDTARGAEVFEDNLTNLRAAAFGVGNILMKEFLPAMTGAAQRLTEFVAAHRTEIVEGFAKAVEVGGQVVGGFTAFAERAWPVIDGVVTAIGGWQNAGLALAALLAVKLLAPLAAFTFQVGKLAWTAASLAPVILKVGAALAGSASAALVPAFVAAKGVVVSFGVALMATPVGWILAAVAAIAGAAYLIYRYWGDIGDFFERIWDSAGKAVGDGIERIGALAGLAAEVGQSFFGMLDGLGQHVFGVWDSAAKAVGDGVERIGALAGFAAEVGRSFFGMFDGLGQHVFGIWESLRGIVSQGVLWIVERVQGLVGMLPDFALDRLGLDGLGDYAARLREGMASGERAAESVLGSTGPAATGGAGVPAFANAAAAAAAAPGVARLEHYLRMVLQVEGLPRGADVKVVEREGVDALELDVGYSRAGFFKD